MSEPVSLASKPRLAPGVRLRKDKVRDAWVLLAPESLIEANSVAVEIIKRCTGDASVNEIVEELAAAFCADRTRVETDVYALLQQLAAKGLVDL